MNTLNGVSQRVAAIYKKYYEDREARRAQNLYAIYEVMADAVESANEEYRLEMDYQRLGELVRSYFLDAIRYKEYHFDPDIDSEKFPHKIKELGLDGLSGISPLSDAWTELVHSTANINKSKVASYTVKWILAYKPITVVNLSSSVSSAQTNVFLSSINEYYAINCAFFTLGIEASKVDPKKFDELVYSFRFRKFDESAYFMILSEDYLLRQAGA
jgi:hypothetical protein